MSRPRLTVAIACVTALLTGCGSSTVETVGTGPRAQPPASAPAVLTPPSAPRLGARMLARGTLRGTHGETVQFSAIAECSAAGSTRPFLIAFGHTIFRKRALTRSVCDVDPGNSYRPAAGFNRQTGTASGTLSDGSAATVAWRFEDRAPGASPQDTVALTVMEGHRILLRVASSPPAPFHGGPGGVSAAS